MTVRQRFIQVHQSFCDGLDNDCDALVDEGLNQTWYEDSDGDSYGNLGVSLVDCVQPSGYVSTSGDCDDTESTVYPGAPEIGDGLDNDCDVLVDEGLNQTWYADSDGDSYGDISVSVIDCAQPSGYVTDNTDCDDSEATVNPGDRGLRWSRQ